MTSRSDGFKKYGRNCTGSRTRWKTLDGAAGTAEPETPTCTHPEDQRISFGVTNGQADWQCRICRFRTPCLPLDPETTTRDHP
jgi:ribosomal protein L37AE/L43A